MLHVNLFIAHYVEFNNNIQCKFSKHAMLMDLAQTMYKEYQSSMVQAPKLERKVTKSKKKRATLMKRDKELTKKDEY